MLISVNKELLKKLPQFKSDLETWEDRFNGFFRYNSSVDFSSIDISEFEEDELNVLFEIASKQSDTPYKNIINKISFYRNLKKNPDNAVVKTLESLPIVGKGVLEKTVNKWLFSEDMGHFVPYFVENITYKPRDARNNSPASVTIRLKYYERGSLTSRSICLNSEDVKGKRTFVEILRVEGYYIETEELVKSYMSEINSFKEFHTLTGHQFLVTGKATICGDRWSSGITDMVRDGKPTKVVMDDTYKESDSRKSSDDENSVSSLFWFSPSSEDGGSVLAPVHPYVKVFDLVKHKYVIIHISGLEKYKYNSTIEKKLILPTNKKDLVDILIQGANHLMEDIISGKTGGIIVLATGCPGTGKTLTAEVYSETIKKPLYVVQCSQLGIDVEDLEKNLTEVLNRASRWGAILLIDEADVYIYERGKDIQQNAIVGVFLRVLEYYRGILFLTSNRATIIDDAILSRCTAHIRYNIPDKDESAKIWVVLSEQFKIKLVDPVEMYVSAFPSISGRTIKNLLKLSKLLSERKKEPIDVALTMYASKFLDGCDNSDK